MARNRRGGRGRGRNRGGLLVKEAAYSTPIVEPCNFMELDFSLTSTGGAQTFALPTALEVSNALPPSQNKFRVTSMVVDPVATYGNGILTPNQGYEVRMNTSGNHYASNSTTKPLKVRFSNAFRSDGAWNFTTDAPADKFGWTGGTIEVEAFNTSTSSNTAEATIHLRVAFTDN